METTNDTTALYGDIEDIIKTQREEPEHIVWKPYNERDLKDFGNYVHSVFENKEIPFPDFASVAVGKNMVQVGWYNQGGIHMSLSVDIATKKISFFSIRNPGNNIVESVNMDFEEFIDNKLMSLFDYFEAIVYNKGISTTKRKSNSLVYSTII